MDTGKLGFVLLAQMGVNIAELGLDGKVKPEQLPKITPESISAEKVGAVTSLQATLQNQVINLQTQITKLQVQVDELNLITKKLLAKK